jgi:hypothetical protein
VIVVRDNPVGADDQFIDSTDALSDLSYARAAITVREGITG